MLFIERRSGPRNELRDLQHVIIRLLDVPQGQVCIGSYMSFPRLPLAPVQEVRLILYHFWFLSIFYLFKKKKIKLHLWEEVVKGQLLGGLPPTM